MIPDRYGFIIAVKGRKQGKYTGNFSNRAAIMAGLSQVIKDRQIIIACYILRHS